jgi:hypothetical protein
VRWGRARCHALAATRHGACCCPARRAAALAGAGGRAAAAAPASAALELEVAIAPDAPCAEDEGMMVSATCN